MSQPTVFVVDDEQQICSLLQRILTREGYTVRAFSDPCEAVVEIERTPPDLVVTDLMMPGMSGLDLIARVRASAPETGVVVITGCASIDSVVDALRSGVDDFVAKPFSVAEIRNVTARLLSHRTVAGRAEVGRTEHEGVAEDAATDAPAAGTEAEPVSPKSGIGYPAGSPTLAGRLTDMTLTERVHGLISAGAHSSELLERSRELLRTALGLAAAALLVPSERDGHRIHAAATHDDERATKIAVPANVLEAVAAVAPGHAVAFDAREAGELASVTCAGPTAVVALATETGPAPTLFVITRAADEPAFSDDDLRQVNVVADALRDVYNALRAAEYAEEAYIDSLTAIVTATEGRTPWFARHSERVRDLALRLGRRVGLGAEELEILEHSARLLDIGRVEIPDKLLAKSGELSADEWRVVREHVAAADTLLHPIGRLRRVKPVMRHHHENWDGTGYPDGLRGEEIPYLASIVRVADAYAALTSARAWRPALTEDEARAKLSALAGRHFHPDLADTFLALLHEDAGADADA